jgi:uncharacterized protein YaiI (UPF0178 family)
MRIALVDGQPHDIAVTQDIFLALADSKLPQ